MATAIAAAGGALFGLGLVTMAFTGIAAWERSRSNLRTWRGDPE